MKIVIVTDVIKKYIYYKDAIRSDSTIKKQQQEKNQRESRDEVVDSKNKRIDLLNHDYLRSMHMLLYTNTEQQLKVKILSLRISILLVYILDRILGL